MEIYGYYYLAFHACFSCFINVGVCAGTILCSLKMGCIKVNTLTARLETCYKKINDLLVN